MLATQEEPGTEPRTIAKVDCTTEKNVAKQMEIKGYPTLYFFKNGQKQKYDGKRKSDDIVKWVNEHAVNTSTGITCEEMQ